MTNSLPHDSASLISSSIPVEHASSVSPLSVYRFHQRELKALRAQLEERLAFSWDSSRQATRRRDASLKENGISRDSVSPAYSTFSKTWPETSLSSYERTLMASDGEARPDPLCMSPRAFTPPSLKATHLSSTITSDSEREFFTPRSQGDSTATERTEVTLLDCLLAQQEDEAQLFHGVCVCRRSPSPIHRRSKTHSPIRTFTPTPRCATPHTFNHLHSRPPFDAASVAPSRSSSRSCYARKQQQSEQRHTAEARIDPTHLPSYEKHFLRRLDQWQKCGPESQHRARYAADSTPGPMPHWTWPMSTPPPIQELHRSRNRLPRSTSRDASSPPLVAGLKSAYADKRGEARSSVSLAWASRAPVQEGFATSGLYAASNNAPWGGPWHQRGKMKEDHISDAGRRYQSDETLHLQVARSLWLKERMRLEDQQSLVYHQERVRAAREALTALMKGSALH